MKNGHTVAFPGNGELGSHSLGDGRQNCFPDSGGGGGGPQSSHLPGRRIRSFQNPTEACFNNRVQLKGSIQGQIKYSLMLKPHKNINGFEGFRAETKI